MTGRSFSVSVPAEPSYLKSVRDFFRAILHDLFGEEAEMLVVALDESCSNFVKHGCAGTPFKEIHIGAEVLEDHVAFRITNFCARDDIPGIKPRPIDQVRPGGLGTHFVNQIMDHVRFEPETGSGRMTLVLEKKLPAGNKRARPRADGS